jgi:tRNA (guanine37-N1)-methyltransferase
MIFSVISIFPELFEPFSKTGLIGKACEKKIVHIDLYDPRDFTANKHRKVDDRPFGGGPGMVMKPEPLFNTIEQIQKRLAGKVILFSAYAPQLTQAKVKQLAQETHLILVCGRYEGVDQRVIDSCVDEEISLGPYVLMGGEVAAQALMESVSRMLDGVVGNRESVESDSFFQDDQIAFPQYTQPRHFRGKSVPEVLLGGHHEEIKKWRQKHQKKGEKEGD